jgi:hypothetical protein
MRKARLAYVALDRGLAAEVGKERVVARVRDAQVDETPDTRARRGGEQDARVGDGPLVGRLAVRKPDPVGVVQDVGAAEEARERVRIGELERCGDDRRAGRRWAAAERPDVATAFQQQLRDRAPRVREGAGDDVEAQNGSGDQSSSRFPSGS